MAYPLLPVVSFVLILPFNKKYEKNSCLKNAFFAGALYGILNIPLIWNFIKVLILIGNHDPGFPFHLPTFMDIAGLYAAASTQNIFLALLVLSNIILVSVLAYQIKKEGYLSFLSINFIIYLLLQLLFCMKFFSPGAGTSYNTFKSALTLSFLAIVLIARFLEDAAAAEVRSFKSIATRVAIAVLLVLNMRATSLEINKSYMWKTSGISIDHEAVKMFSESAYYEN